VAARQGLKYFQILFSSYANKQLTGPLMAGVLVTYRCNAHCLMCDLVKRAGKRPEMTTAELRN